MKLNAIMSAGLMLTMMCSFAGTSPSTPFKEEDCKQYKSLYYQYLIIEAYTDAQLFWLKAYDACAGSDELNSIFFYNGTLIYKKLAEITFASDSVRQHEVEDSTSWIYEEYMKIDSSPKVQLDYAVFLMEQKDTNFGKISDLFRAVDSLKEENSANYLYYSFKHLVFNVFRNSTKEQQGALNTEIFDTYFKLTGYANKAIEKARLGTDKSIAEKTVKTYEKTTELMTTLLLAAVRNCEVVAENMKRQYEFIPADSSWRMDALTEGITLMKRFNCTNSDVYFSYLYAMLDFEPNAQVLADLAKMEMNRGETDKAIQNYQKALSFNPEDSLKSAITYEIALAWYNKGQYKKAVEIAKNVQGQYRGKAIVLCGNSIARLASSCGDSSFSRDANYWLANDYYVRAAEMGERVSKTEFMGKAPKAAAVFAEGLNEGDSYSLSCWNEKTIIRF